MIFIKIKKIIVYFFSFKLFRYLMTGGTLFVVDFLVFYFLRKRMNWDIRVSQMIARGFGAMIGFLAQKLFVFRNYQFKLEILSFQTLFYVGLTVFNIFFSAILIYFVDALSPIKNSLLVKIMTEVVMVAETYFILNVIFKNRLKGEKSEKN